LAYDTRIEIRNKSPNNATVISGITLTNNVVLNGPGSGTDFNVVSNLTLQPNECRTYTPSYTPTQCAGGPPTLTGGRCEFDDTVKVDTAASTPRDQFNQPLPASAIPMPQSASCHVYPFGACTLERPVGARSIGAVGPTHRPSSSCSLPAVPGEAQPCDARH